MDKTFIIFDTETTGLNFEDDKICSLDAIKVSLNKSENRQLPIFRKCGHLGLKFNPGIAISKEASEVNGYIVDKDKPLDDNNLYGFPEFKESAATIVEFFKGSTLVAHNAWFDLNFILKSLSEPDLDFNLLLEFLNNCDDIICTKQSFARIMLKKPSFDYIPGTSLDKLCDFLNVNRDIRKNGHGSEVDTLLTYECFEKLYYIHPESLIPLRIENIQSGDLPRPKGRGFSI